VAHGWLKLVHVVFCVGVGINSAEPSGYATSELIIWLDECSVSLVIYSIVCIAHFLNVINVLQVFISINTELMARSPKQLWLEVISWKHLVVAVNL
jgi:hypothetical protein